MRRVVSFNESEEFMTCNKISCILLTLLVVTVFCEPVVAQTTNTVVVTASVTPTANTVKAVGDSGMIYTITGSYTGSPALQNSEEVPAEAYWMALADGGGSVVYVYNNNNPNPVIGTLYNWQLSRSFNFGFRSQTAGSYTLTLSITLCIAIRHKNTNALMVG